MPSASEAYMIATWCISRLHSFLASLPGLGKSSSKFRVNSLWVCNTLVQMDHGSQLLHVLC